MIPAAPGEIEAAAERLQRVMASIEMVAALA